MGVMITPDARYIIVRGRLWRAANPSLSERERSELTASLMHARRAVRDALRIKDKDAERAARRDVQKAKVGLGERGPVWWTDGAPDFNRHLVRNTPYLEWFLQAELIENAILTLLDLRDSSASICPSEIARQIEPDSWRKYMGEVRDAARRLADRGAVVITQKRKILDPGNAFAGPIRIARPAAGRPNEPDD